MSLDQVANNNDNRKPREELNYVNGVPGLRLSFNTFKELDATKAKAEAWMAANPEVVEEKSLTVDRVIIGYVISHLQNCPDAWIFDGRTHENVVASIGDAGPAFQ